MNPTFATPAIAEAASQAPLRRCGGAQCAPGTCDHDGEVQRSPAGPAPASAPPSVHQVLDTSGEQLDGATRSYLEPRFGHDFSQVRVHADGAAAASATAVGARAYTVGNHVAFAAGSYAPGTADGRRLLAHELTHVVQQAGTPVAPATALEVGDVDDPTEREADRVAEEVMEG